jgi:hypothetical protein
MLRSARKLTGFAVDAANGDVGKVTDLYFDDQAWTVRYLVVDTGGWLSGRSVLISPMAVDSVDWQAQRIHLYLNRERVEEAPGIETNLPVARRMEAEYYRYYGWPNYWAGGGLWGPATTPAAAASLSEETSLSTAAYPPPSEEVDSGDPHLRSLREVTGYRILARDGELGNVEDLLADDGEWSIQQIIIDTTRWWPGGEVIITPEHIWQVNWAERSVAVDMDRQAIKDSPEFRPGKS